MKHILGLDLGTNSIGWALTKSSQDGEHIAAIEAVGSRIIPMDATILGNFAKGNAVSQTAERTKYRGTRRIRERSLLRRERLHRVLDLMGFLPQHYSALLTRYGKFKDNCEPKLAWEKDENGAWHFLFKKSYDEMIEEFKREQQEWLCDNGKVPYDWTIFYLRKKALHEVITKEELSWILLNFNQKRGYYQLRGEDDADIEKDKCVEYQALKVIAVKDSGEKKGKETWYDIELENGMVYQRTAMIKPEWEGKVIELIITTFLDKDGNPKKGKNGAIKRSFRMPKDDDWTLLKKKTEADIDRSNKTIGEYIYDALLHNPMQKIKGKLVRTVERKYYKSELIAILNEQKKHIPELRDKDLYVACINELYGSNDAYRQSIASHDFTYLFVDNIIFYQRPLKSKKSLIADCPYEELKYKDKETGETKLAPVKCIAKSNPLYQEFRLWQFVQNLKIYEREKFVDGVIKTDVDVTDEIFPTENDRVRLFDFLNDRESITQEDLLRLYAKVKRNKAKSYPYRWNYVEDKTYPCNKTRAMILKRWKEANIDIDVLNREMEKRLWHILYSVDDKQEIKKALATFAEKQCLSESFVEVFSNMPPFEKEYGAYSEKAIKKLLPLMRMGKYWCVDDIHSDTQARIDKIITGEYDENIRTRVREKSIHLNDINDFRGLPLSLACYVVYNRHSETKDVNKWEIPADIDKYLAAFKQHTLHNPIVEQIIMETLRTVRDIWKQYGRIDEIHIEMGRDMKNTKDKREKIARRNIENENANLRIKALLTEFLNPEFEIENVRPYSPTQQEILRIYEDDALNSVDEVPDDISEIINKFSQADVKKRPSHSDIMRYKLWLEQKYHSPYTGEMIPLSKLFTPSYEIEHIIPQSRYFDDSFSNKVICESEVNKLKDRMFGMEFIKAHHGEKVQLNMGGEVTILSEQEYQRLVQENYNRNRKKMKKLLMDDIPDQFIERQLNDSRYISKKVMSLLSNIVRENGEKEAISKNVITCNGTITDRLKHDWGISDVWNRIILPRFKRLNTLTGTTKFTSTSTSGHEIPDIPLELQKGFNKKRIDHRHHAMDAIVIACTTRNHVNLLNNEAALSKNNANRYQLSRKLRRYETVNVLRGGETRQIEVAREFLKPWASFTMDVENALNNIIVSFKQNIRVINKTSNRYQHFEDGRKRFIPQKKGDSWAIRKSMHKETVFGEVNLRRIKEVSINDAVKNQQRIVDKDLKEKIKELLSLGYDVKRIKKYFEENRETWNDVNIKKIKIYYFTKETNKRFFATRKPLDASFDVKKITESITDTGIQKILLKHLEENGDDPNVAFSPDGIERMNKDIRRLNNDRVHQPIIKMRVYEMANKFTVGQRGNKSSKFVEAADGTNLFFAIYEKEVINKGTECIEKVRTYTTIPLRTVINRQKNGLLSAPKDENDNPPLFVLSPNDLVYLPTKDELDNETINMPLDIRRIYKMVSSNKNQCFFVIHNVASSIVDKYEFSSLNKMERAITGEMIKETCLPLKVDRLGNIIELNGRKL